jgi:hypothetical protein
LLETVAVGVPTKCGIAASAGVAAAAGMFRFVKHPKRSRRVLVGGPA